MFLGCSAVRVVVRSPYESTNTNYYVRVTECLKRFCLSFKELNGINLSTCVRDTLHHPSIFFINCPIQGWSITQLAYVGCTSCIFRTCDNICVKKKKNSSSHFLFAFGSCSYQLFIIKFTPKDFSGINSFIFVIVKNIKC